MKSPRLIFSSGVALLLIAVALVIYGQNHIPQATFTGPLKSILPTPPLGWSLTERAIAETPEMKEAVGELLNFDDAVFVDYSNNQGQRISVYIAYWKPGKMSHRLVATHTPDVCWVGGGWKKTMAASLDTQMLVVNQPNGAVSTKDQAIKLPLGEDRVFTLNGTTQYVWFWHLVGNESKRYSQEAAPPWYASLADIWEKGINQRDEQFFIRISSDRPLAVQLNDSVLTSVLNRVALITNRISQ